MTTKKILIVDNEEYIREVTKICLESTTKWQVITANSGDEGIKKAELEKPDVILLDVMMPGMDGITAFKHLQQNSETKEIPVIILTATIQSSDNYRYTDLGIKAAIAKPFSPLTLAQEISEVLGWSSNQ
ncbi:response regulator with CheY-like receiver, AAA-type ATPase, and DNA-binding domains [Rivularia sp. PCC 7116]|uniref:response regulator n=1 Tax=Rivularia sp. PCC 7116 TaxID=373994 RepID=UPI00029F3725|nr:response regulator [Rivularia sp. PCC 7116]AFY55497.1 response regulator with CheY-like receiver, AAA-type ATPase, and DNA-binding domains [Rivularia sp. PCC 7116]